MSQNKQRILLTGCNGQVGSEIKELIKGNPDFIFTLTDREDLDLTQKDDIHSYLEKVDPFDAIINCGAFTNVDKAETDIDLARKINEDAVGIFSTYCKSNDAVLIHFSTDYVYHPDHTLVNLEDDPCNPQSIYAATKFQGEERIRESGCKHIIIRTSWVYSRFGKNFVKTMLKLGQSHKELRIVNDQVGSPTHAFDIAEVTLKILYQVLSYPESSPWGTYNFSNLGFVSWAEFAEEIFKLKGLEIKINQIPSSEYPTPAPRPQNSRMSKSKIADIFQIELKNWKNSLREMLRLFENV